MEEALEIAYGDVNVDEIYIEPPDSGALTDEDSGDEDGGGLIDNLPGSQLRAQAEIKLVNNERIGGFTSEPSAEKAQDTSLHSSVAFERQDPKKIHWIQGDFEPNSKQFLKGNYSKFEYYTPVQLFEMFFDEEIMRFLLEESTRYAFFLNCADPKISMSEMKCFLGILIVSGYCEVPGKRFFWDVRSDMRNEMVYNSMRRNRFLEICRFLHFSDNNYPDASDKIWKLRPLMDRIKTKFLNFFEPEEHLCYDESMVKYFGRHSCKQFIRGKPIRFGYKIWCLNTPSGYLVDFEMYQGNNPRRTIEYEKLFGKASEPLVTMLDEVKNAKGFCPFKLYFDNLFTGISLLKFLKDSGYQGTGTLRENRIPKSCTLTRKEAMEKKARGTFESVIDKDDGILFLRWIDNGVVTAASTCFGVHPLTNARRFSRAEKKVVQMPVPNAIAKYNRSMGGTDRMDENIAEYRIAIRSKKWWWCLFTWLLDACIHNAWQIHKNYGGKLTQLEFRRSIAQNYLTSYGVPPKGPGRTSIASNSVTLHRISDDLRYDRTDHLIIRTTNNKRRRCAGEGCSSHVRTICKKCDVGLCIECFAIFHTK